MDNRAWKNLIAFMKREGYGEVKIKFQNGIPVSIPMQVIRRTNRDGSVTYTEVNKSIDLTSE